MKSATIPKSPQVVALTVDAKIEMLRQRVLAAIRHDPDVRIVRT